MNIIIKKYDRGAIRNEHTSNLLLRWDERVYNLTFNIFMFECKYDNFLQNKLQICNKKRRRRIELIYCKINSFVTVTLKLVIWQTSRLSSEHIFVIKVVKNIITF